MSEDGGYLGSPALVRGLRPRRLLRLVQEQACDQALPLHRPPDHQVARARRELDVLLHRRRDVRGRLGRAPAKQRPAIAARRIARCGDARPRPQQMPGLASYAPRRAVDPRTTSSMRRGFGEWTALPARLATSSRAACRPFSPIGWRTVVSPGWAQAAIGRSSKPTTDRSSGTRTPACWAAAITPIAAMSLIASTAVGRRRPAHKRRNAFAPPAQGPPAAS